MKTFAEKTIEKTVTEIEAHMRRWLEDAQDEIANIAEERDKLQAQHAALTQERDELRAKVQEQDQERDHLKKKLDEAVDELRRVGDLYVRFERENESLAKQNKLLTKQNDALRTERNKLRAELEQERHDAEHAVKQWEKALVEIGEYVNSEADLTNERNTLKEEVEELQNQNASLKTSLGRYKCNKEEYYLALEERNRAREQRDAYKERLEELGDDLSVLDIPPDLPRPDAYHIDPNKPPDYYYAEYKALTQERDTLKQENKKLKAELDEVSDTALNERERHESDKLRLERNIEYYKKRLQAWSHWGDKTTAMWQEWRDVDPEAFDIHADIQANEETTLTGEGTFSLSVEKPSETYTAGSTDKILKAASQDT